MPFIIKYKIYKKYIIYTYTITYKQFKKNKKSIKNII